MDRLLLLDTIALSEPGADRGLGRYTRIVSDAASEHGGQRVQEIRSRRDIARHVAAAGGSPVVYHAIAPAHLPARKTSPWVCTILDIIPLDISAYRRFGVKSRLHMRNAVRSDVVVVISRHAASRVIERLGVPEHRVVLSPIPVADAFLEPVREVVAQGLAPRLPDVPYVVVLVDMRTPDPRKRFSWALEIIEPLARRGIATVIAGRGLDSLPDTSAILVPNPTDDELAAIYASALATFYPSGYEGQGLPPLEAMATGCPVIAFANTAIVEVVGDAGYLLDDPQPWQLGAWGAPMPATTVGQIVDITAALRDDARARSDVASRARAQAATFTHEQFSSALGRAYELAFGGSR